MAEPRPRPKATAGPAPTAPRPLNRIPPQRQTGPRKSELLRQYEHHTGLAASPRATKAWLGTEIADARARTGANRRAAALQVAALTTTAVGTYNRKRAEQKAAGGGDDIVAKGMAVATAAYATAPGVALTMVQGAANHASHKYISLPFGLTYKNPLRGPAATVTKVAGRAVLPALAVWSMHNGALEDQNALRGAGRGLVRALDLSAIVLSKGLGERVYDSVAGPATPRPEMGVWDYLGTGGNFDAMQRWQDQHRNGYERFLDDVSKRVFTPAGGAYFRGTASAPPPAAQSPVAVPAPAMPAGATYQRTYTTGNKAGTTEVVRNSR